MTFTSSDGEEAEAAADATVQEGGLFEVNLVPGQELYDDMLVALRVCVRAVGGTEALEEERPVGRGDDELALRVAEEPELERHLQHGPRAS